jgi:hypothetical protein
MHSLDNIIAGFRNPKRILWEIHCIINRKVIYNDGFDMMSQDWDNLIILDACRYDAFKKVNHISGNLSKVLSKGSSTGEFLDNTFNGNHYTDTIYISANPHVKTHNIDRRFFTRARLWETHWDDRLRTVPPEAVTNKSVEINETYPNKRLIVHLIQPHYPFIGDQGREISHATLTGAGEISDEREFATIWDKLAADEIDTKVVWDAYLENLSLALDHVERLENKLDGKTVITSDHGNAFGEYGVYGHPKRRFISPLITVPWLEVNNSRRRIKSADEVMTEQSVGENVEDRLSDLGYT